jgi:hypothetical protein
VIGKFMHVYLDDIFVCSNSIEEHEHHLKLVLDRLRENSLYLKWSKCNLYTKTLDCLGHIIDDQGIHPDSDKMAWICDWQVPRDYNDIQQFVGLVNYVGNFLPDVTAYTGPLLAITQNRAPFNWRPIHQCCFDMIKHICEKTPIIKPVDPKSDKPIWLICDTSKSGVSAMYGQGPTWQKCHPTGFMSKKFTTIQQNYAVHELEMLAILEALLKWEDKLIGYRAYVITDHKALEFFKTQINLSHYQWRWMDYMSHFDFDITYVKGELNKIADCLSHYFKSDATNETHEVHEYVRADAQIDPLGEDLPTPHFHEMKEHVIEIHALRDMEIRQSCRLIEQQEAWDLEAQVMAEANTQPPERENEKPPSIPTDKDSPLLNHDKDMTLTDALFHRTSEAAPVAAGDKEFLCMVQGGYEQDALFAIVLEKPREHKGFTICNNLIWCKNICDDKVLCIP